LARRVQLASGGRNSNAPAAAHATASCSTLIDRNTTTTPMRLK
jgi:hypothetical protein